MLYNGDAEWTAAREISELFVEMPEELRAMLQEKTHRTWEEMQRDKWEKIGRQEGRQEGRLQGRIELLEEQLQTKFGPLDDSLRTRLHEASSPELLRWGTRFVTADSLEDVFG